MSRPENSSRAAADVVGHYRLVRELGRGGMATVHEARHLRLPRRVAIKRMLPELASEPTALARFAREASIAATLRHPNVVNVFDSGLENGIPYLVMELLEGRTLAATLASSAPLPVADGVDLFLPLFSAVAACHAAGIVHRDLKPENVFLARAKDGACMPTILDFGVAKGAIVDDGPPVSLTASGVLVGTLEYMAPEQIQDAKSAGPASDQFALGVMLYRALTGRMPFSGASPQEIMQAILNQTPVGAGELAANIPEGVDRAIMRALARNPGDRHSSVLALASALLLHASPACAERWKAEVLRGEGSALQADGGTLADVRLGNGYDPQPTKSEGAHAIDRPASRAPVRRGIRALVALAAVVTFGVGTIAITRKPAGDGASANALAPATSSQSDVRNAPLPEPPLPIEARVPSDLVATSLALEVHSEVTPTSRSAPSGSEGGNPSSSRRAGRSKDAPPVASTAPLYRGSRGTNGAPIVE